MRSMPTPAPQPTTSGSIQVARFKTIVSQEYADLIYNGLWFSAFHQDLFALVASNQRFVTVQVRVKLFKGKATVVGRKSE
jgi:argininosuccinate synthase